MTVQASSTAHHASWAAVGLSGSCVAIASAHAALEFASPINSGIGPLYSFVQLPIFLLISAMLSAVVAFIAKAAGWPPLRQRSHSALLGVICSLATAQTLLSPWIQDLRAFLLVTPVVLLIAALLRARLGRQNGA